VLRQDRQVFRGEGKVKMHTQSDLEAMGAEIIRLLDTLGYLYNEKRILHAPDLPTLAGYVRAINNSHEGE